MQQLRSAGDAQLEVQRHTAAQACRPAFSTLSPAERAGELISRMDVAKQHGDKAAFLAAQNELRLLVEEL